MPMCQIKKLSIAQHRLSCLVGRPASSRTNPFFQSKERAGRAVGVRKRNHFCSCKASVKSRSTATFKETHTLKVWSIASGKALSPLLSSRNSVRLLKNNTFADLVVAVSKDDADIDPKRTELRKVVVSSGAKSRDGSTTESKCFTRCGADTCTAVRRPRLRKGRILSFVVQHVVVDNVQLARQARLCLRRRHLDLGSIRIVRLDEMLVLSRLLSMLPNQRRDGCRRTKSRRSMVVAVVVAPAATAYGGGGQIMESAIRRSLRIMCRAGRKDFCMILGRGDIHDRVIKPSHHGNGQVRDDPLLTVRDETIQNVERMQLAERDGQRRARGRIIAAAADQGQEAGEDMFRTQ
jgi:hypothetical protein